MEGLAWVAGVVALGALLGADPSAPPPPLSTVELPGTIVGAVHAPVAITACRASIVRRAAAGRYALSFQPFAAYRNVSEKPVDAVAVSITQLDAKGAEIEEHIHSDSPNFQPRQTFTSHWISYEYPPDVAAVRCALRAVQYTDGSTWGTWPNTPDERNRAIRPVPCGPVLNRPQQAIALLEPRPGARNVDPRRVRVTLHSEYPMLGRVYELRLVPDAGHVIHLTGYDQMKQLFEPANDAVQFDGAVDIAGLEARTNYRVVVDVLDMQRSREHCPAILEESLGAFTTA